MNYEVLKLHFTTGIHIGKQKLTDCEYTIGADTIFSALCQEALLLGNEDELDHLVKLTKNGELRISDGLPYNDHTYYIPKPLVSVEHEMDSNSSEMKKAYKKLHFVDVEKVDEYISGNMDVVKENYELSHMGSSNLRTMVSIETERTTPFFIGTYSFNEGWGIYIIVEYATKDVIEFVIKLMDSLGYSGIGGKRSSGFGKFTIERISAPPKRFAEGLNGRGIGRRVLLSYGLPSDDDLEEALDGATFMVERRGGFVSSDTYSEVPNKKKDIYLFKAGSAFKRPFDGVIADVSIGGAHPVYKYAKPIFIEV